MSRLLVVDDEVRIVSFVSRALSAEGFTVDGAYDGKRGLELARSGIYDLMVLDLLLPGMDGVSVLKSIIETRPDQRGWSSRRSRTWPLGLIAWSWERSTTCPNPSPWPSCWLECEPACASRLLVRMAGSSLREA